MNAEREQRAEQSEKCKPIASPIPAIANVIESNRVDRQIEIIAKTESE